MIPHVILIAVLSFTAFVTGKPGVVKECGGKPADIVFVLDESGSIWGPDFTERQLAFVSDMVGIFDIGPTKTQISVVTFSDNPKNHFYLNDYSNEKDMKAAVKSISQRRGGTKTFDAISFMRKESFAPGHGARKGVAKIAIIVTDGESEDKARTIAQADLAKEAGIVVFALGVGHRIKVDEVQAIASKPSSKYYYKVDNYNALKEIQRELAYKTCVVTTLPPPTTTTTLPQMIEGCRGKYTIDAVFALPERTGSRENNIAIDFVKSLASGASISPEKVQFGLAPSACEKTPGIKLNECSTKPILLLELEERKSQGSNPEIAMNTLRKNSFSPTEGGRGESIKFGIVIIDDKLAEPEKAIEESELAKDTMQLVIITVGDDVTADEDTLTELATSSSHYFHVNDYKSLEGLKHKLEELFCNGVKNGLRRA